MKMKTKLIALSVLAASVVSASSMAAITDGQLDFNWQGVIPTNPITSSTASWAFVDGFDNIYSPTTEQLTVKLDDKGDMTAASVKPYDFFIIPVDTAKLASSNTLPAIGAHVDRSTTATFSANGVKAYLGANPVSTGLNGGKQLTLAKDVVAKEGEVAIVLNGLPLAVGSLAAIDLNTMATKDVHVNIAFNAKANKVDVTENASINFVAPVIFSVDVM